MSMDEEAPVLVKIGDLGGSRITPFLKGKTVHWEWMAPELAVCLTVTFFIFL